MGALQVKW